MAARSHCSGHFLVALFGVLLIVKSTKAYCNIVLCHMLWYPSKRSSYHRYVEQLISDITGIYCDRRNNTVKVRLEGRGILSMLC